MMYGLLEMNEGCEPEINARGLVKTNQIDSEGEDNLIYSDLEVMLRGNVHDC